MRLYYYLVGYAVCNFVYFFTSDATAMGGNQEEVGNERCDFEHIKEGKIHFSDGETSKSIVVNVKPTQEVCIT